MFTVRDIAPDVAAEMKGVSKHYSFLKATMHTKPVDKDYAKLVRFPIFINLNVQLTLDSGCAVKDKSKLNLRFGKNEIQTSCVDILMEIEVMTAMSQSDAKASEAVKVNDHQNKFLTLIKNKQLAANHLASEVMSVHADTDEGYVSFVVEHRSDIIHDFECLVHMLAMKACVSTTHSTEPAGMSCLIEEDGAIPHITISDRDPDTVVSVTRPSLDIPFLHFRTQFTLSTRLVA